MDLSPSEDWDAQASQAYRAMVHDRNLRFPRKPRMVDDLMIFAMPYGLGIQIRGAPAKVLFRGADATGAIGYLNDALDGSLSLDEIIGRRPQSISESTIIKVLWLLHSRGLLVSENETASSKALLDPPLGRQLAFWGRYLSITRDAATASDVQDRIASTRLTLVGGGSVGVASYDLLLRTGYRQIDVLDWDDDGQLLEAIGDLPGDGRYAHLTVTSTSAAEVKLRTWMESTDLLVAVTRNAPSRLFTVLNGLSLEYRVPWLRSNLNGSEFEIGPLVFPFDSGCFTCMEIREQRSSNYPVEERLFQDSIAHDRTAGQTPPLGEAIVFASLCSSLVVGEIVRFTSKLVPPTLVNKVMSTSFLDNGFRMNTFLRLPRCPDCLKGQASLQAPQWI